MKTCNATRQLLRDKEAAHMLGISRSYLWQQVKKGRLPAPHKLGARFTAWKIADLMMVVENPEQYFGHGGALRTSRNRAATRSQDKNR